jgi:hypothetical protein
MFIYKPIAIVAKNENNVGFAVIQDPDKLLVCGNLPPFFSIFDAESQALLTSLKVVNNLRGKYVILTDSLSVFNAIQNMYCNQEIINEIQQLIIKLARKIKIMWIPSHAGIPGNECADKQAKIATTSPLHTYIPLSTKFIKKYMANQLLNHELSKWSRYNHHYKNVNPQRKALKLPTTTNCPMNRCFTRLRLGHKNITHSYIFKKAPPPTCRFCNNCQLTVKHLFECPLTRDIKEKLLGQNSTSLILGDAS